MGGLGKTHGRSSLDRAVARLTQDASLLATKEKSGLISGEVKARLFNDLGPGAS